MNEKNSFLVACYYGKIVIYKVCPMKREEPCSFFCFNLQFNFVYFPTIGRFYSFSHKLNYSIFCVIHMFFVRNIFLLKGNKFFVTFEGDSIKFSEEKVNNFFFFHSISIPMLFSIQFCCCCCC